MAITPQGRRQQLVRFKLPPEMPLVEQKAAVLCCRPYQSVLCCCSSGRVLASSELTQCLCLLQALAPVDSSRFCQVQAWTVLCCCTPQQQLAACRFSADTVLLLLAGPCSSWMRTFTAGS